MLKRERINRFLQLNQLATLTDPRNLLAQLALGITDHDRFRGMLLRVEPEKRQAAYDAMKSRLRFEAKPLEAYIAEGKAIAEREQWPIYDHKTGLTKSCESGTLDSLAQDAIRRNGQDKSGKSLAIVCRKCTMEARIPAKSKSEGFRAAIRAGWTVERIGPPNLAIVKTLCPQCSAERVQ